MDDDGRPNLVLNETPKPHRPGWDGLLRLAYPGMGIKRWLLVGALGIAFCSIGTAYLLRKLLEIPFPDFLPSYYEGLALIAGGMIVLLLAAYGLYRSIGPLVFASETLNSLADTIYTRRSRGRGPKIVAIGGGTGLSVLLRGLKAHTDNLTAIISVGDDGGSSGRLRRELGILPPGDFRNCLVAMSDAESLLTDLFQYRFDEGDGLKGHSFGNLFLVAMTDITQSFQQALHESSRVLAVHGRLLPSTTVDLSLTAYLKDGVTVHGESNITTHGGEIEQLFIEPAEAEAYPLAIEAIKQAQLVIIGPGSLYTSILPNLLVSGIANAIRDTQALKMYICNVALEQGETEGYSAANHLEAIQTHTVPNIVDYMIANDTHTNLDNHIGAGIVMNDGNPLTHAMLVLGNIVDPIQPIRHDSTRLARLIMDVYHRRRKNKAS